MVIDIHRRFLLQFSAMSFLFLILFLCMHLLQTEWNETYNIVKRHHVPVIPAIPTDGEIQKIPTPTGMQKTNAWRHTSAIGTTISPTIDGGIINAADGLGVNQPPTVIAVIKNEVKNNEPTKDIQTSLHNESNQRNASKKFSDDWATSNRVKKILDDAIKTGSLDYVLTETRARNMPASVALVPVVESSYKNNAISNKGAVGSWQLMPQTARENGINPEERMQFVPATKAALNFLSQLHQEFGSWELAYAAYNAGGATVKAAIQKNPNATTIEELDLPQETKSYVLRLKKINMALITDEKINSKRRIEQV